MRTLFRHSLAMLQSGRLIGLHLAGNAVLLVTASLWLLIPEQHVWQLLCAAVLAVLLLVLFSWIHSGTLVYAAEPAAETFRPAFRLRLGRMGWLLLGMVILFVLMWRVDGWQDYEWQTAGYLYAKAPSFLRPTGGESSYVRILHFSTAVLLWYLLPCLLLPWMAAKVVGTKLRAGLRTLLQWRYWLGMAATVVVGVWLTNLLLDWTPGHSLKQQTAGLVLRLTIAYLLATAAWLVTAGVLGYFVGGCGMLQSPD